MPPKNAQKGGASQSKKTEQKKKDKVIEDKTFGLKNKKGAKQQRFIQQVQHQVKFGGNKSARELEKEKENLLKKKEDKKKELAEINALFKPVQQLAGKGTDPKSILCAFFKQGTCGKGAKCKFSHDLAVERKSEKRSAYVDVRDCENETSADWDEAKLMDVVEQKHGKEKNKPTTDIVCRYFLDAVESGKYGWFWECANGGNCIYRHALPPGFVLKKDRKKMGQKEEISLEDLIERERAALGANTTRVTLETFLSWKKRKLKEKEDVIQKDSDKKKKDYNMGKVDMGLSGREMFTFNPDLAVDGEDIEEGDESFDVRNMKMDPDDQDEELKYKEISVNELLSEYQEAEGSSGVSIANPDRLQLLRDNIALDAAANTLSETNGEEEGAVGGTSGEGSVDIDEDLFDGDDEDLEELEEQLEDMAVA